MLTNGGQLEVFFVGNGSALNLVKNNNNILLIKGEDHLLLDCGITCPRALYETTGLSPDKITNIAISHLHGDHVGGLEVFGWYHCINKSVARVWSKVNTLSVLWTPMDFMAHEAFRLMSNDIWEFHVGSIKVKFVKTQHVDNIKSYGYIVDDRVLFTMDSCFSPELLKDYDVIFHDCSSKKNPVHACIEELRTLPKEMKSKMWLMHLDEGDYGNVDDFKGFVPVGKKVSV